MLCNNLHTQQRKVMYGSDIFDENASISVMALSVSDVSVSFASKRERIFGV